MVQPIKDTVTGYKTALLNGEITEGEYISLLYLHVQVIKVKIVLLDILMASDKAVNEFRETLNKILPWRVRAAGNMPRVIGGAHL